MLTHQVYSKPTLAGIPTYDSIGKPPMSHICLLNPNLCTIGIVSMLMFWSMLEMGFAMIAVCIPTLRPIFNGWSTEAVIRILGFPLALRSLGSKLKPYRVSSSKRDKRSESQTSLAELGMWGSPAHRARHQAYAMGPTRTHESENQVPAAAVRVDKELTQTVDIVDDLGVRGIPRTLVKG